MLIALAPPRPRPRRARARAASHAGPGDCGSEREQLAVPVPPDSRQAPERQRHHRPARPRLLCGSCCGAGFGCVGGGVGCVEGDGVRRLVEQGGQRAAQLLRALQPPQRSSAHPLSRPAHQRRTRPAPGGAARCRSANNQHAERRAYRAEAERDAHLRCRPAKRRLHTGGSPRPACQRRPLARALAALRRARPRRCVRAAAPAGIPSLQLQAGGERPCSPRRPRPPITYAKRVRALCQARTRNRDARIGSYTCEKIECAIARAR